MRLVKQEIGTHELTVRTPSTTPVLELSVHLWEQPAVYMGELAADKQIDGTTWPSR